MRRTLGNGGLASIITLVFAYLGFSVAPNQQIMHKTKENIIRKIIIFLLMLTFILVGCSAKKALPQAKSVEIVNELPDKSKCKFLAEVVGSQGNEITGDITSNKNLIIGARNELRNQTYKLGGNLVHVQNSSNVSGFGATGTTNTTIVGKAYKCRR